MSVIAPIALPIIGISMSTIIIGAGVSGLLAYFFGELTWGEFWKQMGIGALTCLISGGVSTIAKGILGKLSVVATQMNKLLKVSKVVIESFISAGTAIIIENKIEGKPFEFKKLISVFFGNLLSYGIANGFNNFYKKITNQCTKLWKKATLDRLKPFTEFLKKWRVDQLCHYPLAELSKNYLTSTSVYLTDSLIRMREVKINWKGSLKLP
jgi:hypothetical protein